MRKAFTGIVMLGFCLSAQAVVNMKNANYSETWTDIVVPGSGFELRIARTYNSRSLFNGIFGFGWCSDYETKIDVLSDGQLRLTECGGGLETNYSLKNFAGASVEKAVQKIVEVYKQKNPSVSKAELDELKSQIEKSQYARERKADELGIENKAVAGQVYRANGVEDETIKFENGQYVRNLANGTFQKFDAKGHLVSMSNRNSDSLKIDYAGDKISKVIDNNGRQLNFSYVGDRIAKITGPNGLEATYKHTGEDLVEAKNQWKNVYKFSYDKLHNLVRADYPDNTYKALTYNEDRDWVTSFRNRKGCVEKYTYDVKKLATDDYHTSSVKKECDGKVTNNSTYEFFYKTDPKTKATYLQRVRSKVNGAKSEYVYHPVHGKPILTSEGGVATEYSYFDDGNMKSKKIPTAEFNYEYKNACNKVSDVTTKYFGVRTPATPTQTDPKVELLRTVKTQFSYDKRCNLQVAQNTDGQIAKLFYDLKGRIVKIEDQSKKIVNIEYEPRFGKPSLVARPGLGSMKVIYKSDGSIEKVESKDGPRVVAQVSNVFNNLLEVIGPATAQLSL